MGLVLQAVANSSNFCNCNSNGNANYNNASNAGACIPITLALDIQSDVTVLRFQR